MYKIMANRKVNFKIGDYVKVKKGILCSDNADYIIEDWQGKIIKTSVIVQKESLVLIKWDSLTLKNMPENFIIESIQEDLKFEEMYLDINEIVHTSCRDKDQDEDEIVNQINKKYDHIQPKIGGTGNDELDKQEHRIAEILKGINRNNENKIEEKWEEYLDSNLKFPFEAIIIDRDEDTGVLDNGDIVIVKKIQGTFDLYGIVVEIRKGRKKYEIPLCELEVHNKSSDNYIMIEDYNLWFANN
jgi:hypothetical protein